MITNRSFALKMIIWSLIRRRSRLLVALTGVTIGATVLLGLVTLCYDIPRQLSREFRSYGANMVFVKDGVTGRISRDSLAEVAKVLPAERLVGLTPFRYEPVRNHLLPYTAVGTSFADVRRTSPFWQVTGAWPVSGGELLIGVDVAEATGLAPGSLMALDGRNTAQARYEKDFSVAGIVSTGGVEDGFIYMSLEDMEEMTRESGLVDLAEASLTSGGASLSELVGLIRAGVPGVEPRLVTRVTRSEETVLSKLTWLVYLVTLVVLTLTMICVTTTMMTVVLERRKEIGLKKALGAENRRVAREFLGEGLMLGVIGGLLGSATGLLFARVVSVSVFGRGLNPEAHLIPITVLVSALVTVLASLWPVRRAVDVEPALVLRGE
ncbi:MAG: ABC transporter permease [Deltaproteobacteria bacterium]|jgi:putative ABC transport system permease protein|nr:ABC transporter permease [Deltaproteobacteria bacterium]